jgi:hypothetical protein
MANSNRPRRNPRPLGSCPRCTRWRHRPGPSGSRTVHHQSSRCRQSTRRKSRRRSPRRSGSRNRNGRSGRYCSPCPACSCRSSEAARRLGFAGTSERADRSGTPSRSGGATWAPPAQRRPSRPLRSRPPRPPRSRRYRRRWAHSIRTRRRTRSTGESPASARGDCTRPRDLARLPRSCHNHKNVPGQGLNSKSERSKNTGTARSCSRLRELRSLSRSVWFR